MKSLLVLYKTEFKLALREFSGVLFGILLPIGIMLLLGILYGDKLAYENAPYTLLQQSVAAVLTVGICATGLMGVPITLSGYREKKILKRFKASPASPLLLILAQFLNNLTYAIISSVAVVSIAVFCFGYRMIGNPALFILSYFLLMAAIYAIGAVIASVAKSEKIANMLCTLFYFPMFFLSGATIPYELMPKGLKLFADVMPLTQGIKLLKATSLGAWQNDSMNAVWILIFTAILGMIIAVKTFKYEYES